MGGSSHEDQQTQQVQQNTIDPDQKALLMGNYATAQANASKLDTPYNGILTAGFNPTQYQAQGMFSALGANPSYMNNANAATSAVGGVLGSPLNGNINATPTNAAQVGTPNNVTAGMLAGTDLSPYMNPYQNDVINASISDNERARQQAQVADSQKAAAAGAFGGSRSGVLASLTNGEYDRNNQSNIANLNAANFTQAQAGATGDINRKLGVDQFNTTNQMNADQYNANNQQNTGQFNAGQNMNAQQGSFANNMAVQQGILSAASALQGANNNALSTATQQAGLIGSVGDVQQQQEQSQLSNAYQNWLTGQNMTAQEQSILNSALGLMPSQQTVTTNGNASADKSTTPGATDILGGIGSAGMGLGSMGLGFSDTAPKPLRFDPHARRWSSFRYVPDPSLLKEAA